MIFPSGLRTWLVPSGHRAAQLVQHDVVVPPAVVLQAGQAGAAAVGPMHHVVRFAARGGLVAAARVQAVPHLTKKSAPQRGEVLPRRRGGNDGGPAGLHLSEAHLVVHPAIIALRHRRCHQ